jgi:hypothetical protein
MYTPVKEVLYSVWDPIHHEHLLRTCELRQAELFYESHSRRNELELWKIITLDDGNVEHIKVS